MKKQVFFFFLLVKCNLLFSLSLEYLITVALKNNMDIKTAYNTFRSVKISKESLNGHYSPKILFSSSVSLPKYYNWNDTPDYFSSSVTYNQPLGGGTTLNVIGGLNLSFTDIQEERYILHNPNIVFSLSQSLYPFWIQGSLRNPESLNAEFQEEYYYNQLLQTKKTVIFNIIENYVYALIYSNQMQIYKNSIFLLNEEIDALRQMKIQGGVNQSKITQLNNSKLNIQQNLREVQTLYLNYIKNLETICCYDIDPSITLDGEMSPIEKFYVIIQSSMDDTNDPLGKNYQLNIKLLESTRVLEKQNAAPILAFSVKPVWESERTRQIEWKNVWNNITTHPIWTAGIDLDISPLLMSVIKQEKKQYEINLKQANDLYSSYLYQKNIVKYQYELLLEHYKEQLLESNNSYEEIKKELFDFESQYKTGVISQLEYDSLSINVRNSYLNKNNIELYVWLYELLLKYN